MTLSIALNVAFKEVTCYSCGAYFAMEQGYYNDRRNDRRTFYCPNGHAQHFIAETDADKYKRLWKQEQDYAASVAAAKDQAEASLRATKGVVTKMRKRAIAGACQFCHRHFANVERHVNSQHPNEVADE